MHFVKKDPGQKRIDFVNKLKSKKIVRAPGAYNPLTAKLIQEIGYDAVYVSGGVMAKDITKADKPKPEKPLISPAKKQIRIKNNRSVLFNANM